MLLRRHSTPSGVWKHQVCKDRNCFGKWQRSWRSIRRSWQPSRPLIMVRYTSSRIMFDWNNHDAGKTFTWALAADVTASIDVIKYYAGWADKLTGQTLEVCSGLDLKRWCSPSNIGRLTRLNFPTRETNQSALWARSSLVCFLNYHS